MHPSCYPFPCRLCSASTDGWDKSTCLQHMSADDNPSSVLFILKTADGRKGGAFCEQLDVEASTVERVMCFGDTIAERFPSGHAPPCYYSDVNIRSSPLMPSKPVITLAASDQSFDATSGGSVWGGSTNGTIWAGMTNGWGFELKIGVRGDLRMYEATVRRMHRFGGPVCWSFIAAHGQMGELLRGQGRVDELEIWRVGHA